MEREAIEQNPPLPINNSNISIATNDQFLMNYPSDNQALTLPTFTQFPTDLLDHQQLTPLDIDWVTLPSAGSPAGPTVASSSSTSVANNGCGGCGGGEGTDHGVRMNRRRSSCRRKDGVTKKTVPPRFAFHTRSVDDVLDDGYKWRKYGQKSVKNSIHPRSYYRCTYHTCSVKKQIQRLSKDTSIAVTTYEDVHNHPSEKLMETLTPLLRQLQFLAQF